MDKPVISQSPHLGSVDSSRGIMLDVIIALCPAAIAGIVLFGWQAALVIVTCIASAVLSEYLTGRILKRDPSVKDLSAVVTGLLLGLNLPPAIPLWIAALGSAVAIVVVKMLFGGIGQNFANPAITARIVLMVSFPSLMTTWSEPYAWLNGTYSAVSGATPLVDASGYTLKELFFGVTPGCIGETCALLLLVGGLYLVLRRVISPIIPVAFITTVGIFSWIFGGDPLTAVLSGGVMLGAIFMATDYVTSPLTDSGKLIFGIGCGLITFLIRQFGSLPEGVSFSILLMNILTPHINRLTMPKPLGWEAAKK